MALTVLKQPRQFKLTYTDSPGTLSNYFSVARITTPVAHFLTEDQAVFIRSNYDRYNGIKFVSIIVGTEFALKDYPGGPQIAYVNGSGDSVAYRYSLLEHGWQSAHLPIVYEIESDRYPNNTVQDDYTPRTISSIANESGYMRLNLAVQLPNPVTALSFVQLEDGVSREIYQIIRVINNYSIVINLAYDAGFTTTGVLVTTWYNNYAINVSVWCGLPASHLWASYKPYELAGTLKFVPGDDNKVRFSISEMVKSYITTRNKLTLDTLPNNIDFFTFFYIEYYESFDSSDGTEITTAYNGKNVEGFTHSPLQLPMSLWGTVNSSSEPMAWTIAGSPYCTVSSGVSVGGKSDFIGPTVNSYEEGRTYKYSYAFKAYSDDTDPVRIRLQLTDVFLTVQLEKIESTTATIAGQDVIGEWEFVCPAGVTRFGIIVDYPSGSAHNGLISIEEIVDLTQDIPASNSGIRDTFEGIAVNSKLPFKNMNISGMSDYLDAAPQYAKFLVLNTEPKAYPYRFFDISFLNQHDDGDIVLAISKKLSGVEIATENVNFGNIDKGVIRLPIAIESGYDQYCVYAGIAVTQVAEYTFDDSFDEWFNTANGVTPSTGGSTSNWSTSTDFSGSLKATTVNSFGVKSLRLSSIIIPTQAFDIIVKWAAPASASSTLLKMTFIIRDASNTQLYNNDITVSPTGSEQTTTFSITSSTIWLNADHFLITVGSTSFVAGDDLHITNIEIVTDAEYIQPITETLCIDIEGACAIPSSVITGGFVELEGGEFIDLEDGTGIIELE